jgi:hypothetical protein
MIEAAVNCDPTRPCSRANGMSPMYRFLCQNTDTPAPQGNHRTVSKHAGIPAQFILDPIERYV